ncbi:MAG: hypothetical protein EAZ84_00945 [Verrucomicrobia bacterium]|nr:MAG: hypothetical protein EAZ84_00945 [Verrucomicrobiota bacterium]TAE87884.1 MAG: hypothetical protein EAZ82_06625 [Verrucomicrobiota bacterium]TAF25627.1 MAG: hypothetical protein EAZ71_07550 [Verrucomicrobiota bacterium]
MASIKALPGGLDEAGSAEFVPDMHYGVFGSLLLLKSLSIAALIAQCIGLIGLRRAGKNAAWWTMCAGLILQAVSVLASFALGIIPTVPMVLTIAFSLPLFSSLIFAIGFTLHGLRAARAADRLAELENLASAMSEEITRLREGGTTK